MVDPRVVAAVREALAGERRRVLVTGGTGFVGSRVAWLLAEAGHDVTIAGRNRYRLGRARHPAVNFVACDVRDGDAIARVCADHDVVIHSAALSSPWGPWESFRRHNVEGTRNVVDACCRRAGTRLVYISSTAIHFEFRNKLDLAEDAPLPSRFACDYARSKAEAEEVVRRAAAEGVNAVILRARAVVGPGDNSLLPRLLAAASRGRLPQIGSGENVVDLTYVDNLAYAICLAIVRGEPGALCTIVNEEPVALWPTLERMFRTLGMPPIRRRLSYRAALAVAGVAEQAHRLLRRVGEPMLTRYGVGLLAKSQTFSPAAARRVLDYRPLVPLEDGIRTTLAALTAKDDAHAATIVECRLFTTGYTPQPYGLAERGKAFARQRFHASCALLRHPRHGLFLFDTGYAPRFRDAVRRFPYRIYGLISPVVVSERLSIRVQLVELGIDPRDVRGIIVSHFHADHVAGLRDFPEAEIIASDRAWNAVAGRRGMAALRRAFLPKLMPDDTASRMRTLEHFRDPGIGPFAHTHDLFGDGSVRLVELSGHAFGQIGALVQTGAEQRTLLAADAVWTLGSLAACRPPHPLTYTIIDSARELRETIRRLHEFSRQFPSVEIVPTHCPEIAARHGFDAVVDRLKESH